MPGDTTTSMNKKPKQLENCIINTRLKTVTTIYKVGLHCKNQLFKISTFMQLVKVAVHLLF